MEYKSLSEVAESTHVSAGVTVSARAMRRERLERFAALLDAHKGPIRLLARIDYLSAKQRARLRAETSPLTIAFGDPVFRAQGLNGDRLGDAMDFFSLREGQAHYLLCDCHYPDAVTPAIIAGRARSVAQKPTLSELWDKIRRAFMRRTPKPS